VKADPELDAAVWLLAVLLDGVVMDGGPCEYGGCNAEGVPYRNGVWCQRHARKMEWRSV
jgi:hypothetical protein